MSKLLPDVQQLEREIAIDTGSPNIEVPNEAVTYDAGWKTTNYPSAGAFQTKFGNVDFAGELKEFSQVWELLQEGEKLVAMLYTFRSCSQALKDVQVPADMPKETKHDIYSKEFKIFRPEIVKLLRLKNFHERAIKHFKALITSLAKPEKRKEIHSQVKLDLVVRVLDLLIKLDKLKDMKSNLVNDFAKYKRAVALIGSSLPNKKALEDEVFQLQSFLSNAAHPTGYIVWSAKKEIENVADAKEVIFLLLNHCKEQLETHRYLLPDEEHRAYRVIVYLMYILDAEKGNPRGTNAFKEARAHFALKLLKHNPIIPLFGDMQIQIKYDLDRSQHWAQFKENFDYDTVKIKDSYMIDAKKRDVIRRNYSSYTSNFCSLMNRIRAIKSQAGFTEKISMELCEETFNTIIEGITLISSWNSQIRNQSSYKCSHPLDEKQYRAAGGNGQKGHEYERVVRYAYNNREKAILVDVIGMLKGLGSLLQKSETIFIDLCWRHIHDKMQHFAHAMLTRPMRKAMKNKRHIILEIMKSMRAICADYIQGQEMSEDYKQQKKDILEIEYKFPNRFTPPTIEQLILMRRMMNFICSERAEGNKGGMFKKRDLKKEWQDEWLKLYSDSFYYKYILTFKETLRQSMDLSFLWYREFYLNMTKQPQFPIDMSMPWILTNFVIKGQKMKENILYPMEIYNDAAELALSYLDQRYLFDEIEAEVNLAFDQLLIHLSREIFFYFKTLAGSILIDCNFKQAYDRFKSGSLRVPVSRYTTLMSQQTVRLLGRVVNLQVLLAQHVLNNFRKNIRGIIKKFQSSPLSNSVETKALIENAKLAHILASAHLPLDSFEVIFKEMDGRVQLRQGCGRIAQQIADELTGDIFPHWIFCSGTRRFVPSVVSYAEKYQREMQKVKLPKYFWYGNGYFQPNAMIQGPFKKFFGREHVEALLSIIDTADLPFILREVISFIEGVLAESLMPSMEKVQQVLQKAPIPLPPAHLGSALAYSSLTSNNIIKAVRGWPALKKVFFQSLREIGNALAFVQLLETVMNSRNDSSFVQAAFYMGVSPHPSKSIGQEAPLTPFAVDEKKAKTFFDTVNKVNDQFSKGSLVHKEIAISMNKAQAYMSRMLGPNTSIFSATLSRLSEILETVQVFDGEEPANGVLDTHRGTDFARVFSIAQFIFCISPTKMIDGKEVKSGMEEHAILGDGFLWGGTVLVHLLGYTSRFEMLDLCNHIINISDDLLSGLGLTPDQQKKLDKHGGAKLNTMKLQTLAMQRFMRNAKFVSACNSLVFSTIKSYFAVNPVKDLRFSPPKAQ
mmetsp:Transcript_3212/g.4850  ORF Transcript_3212/g.4850 Transcript_3212/m.4850 type:complete len:1295 (+) Transcript_3212:39-3923(+)